MSDNNKKQQKENARRRFLRDSLSAAAGAFVLAVGLGAYQRSAQAVPARAIRPPGALPEKKFQAACLRCGQCVRACHANLLRNNDMPEMSTEGPAEVNPNASVELEPVLRLAESGNDIPTGTPYFIPRISPCRLCEDMPCVQACPSGALSEKNLLDKEKKEPSIYQARMGLAVLINHENCIGFQGLRCDVCYRNCPVIDKALTLDMQVNQRTGVHTRFIPTVHSEHCTGCGKCERSCILEHPAIKVLPLALARGELGHHYRLGWQEKEEAGKSLIPEALQLPARRPEELL
ncbi:ferredoxin-type protein NapG [Candidatus Electrothrix sp.]|uniref:ferredoxin-type protein NapG n=1 Tax=Candidatus Electrothrix sp. TaxID=2170559 RepID=UPI004055A4A7